LNDFTAIEQEEIRGSIQLRYGRMMFEKK